jgi:hypothetical protein
MTEPTAPRPVPGPVRPVPGTDRNDGGQPTDGGTRADRFRDLSERPVAEHVEVFEAEHARLQAELGTIDRL